MTGGARWSALAWCLVVAGCGLVADTVTAPVRLAGAAVGTTADLAAGAATGVATTGARAAAGVTASAATGVASAATGAAVSGASTVGTAAVAGTAAAAGAAVGTTAAVASSSAAPSASNPSASNPTEGSGGIDPAVQRGSLEARRRTVNAALDDDTLESRTAAADSAGRDLREVLEACLAAGSVEAATAALVRQGWTETGPVGFGADRGQGYGKAGVSAVLASGGCTFRSPNLTVSQARSDTLRYLGDRFPGRWTQIPERCGGFDLPGAAIGFETTAGCAGLGVAVSITGPK